MQKRKFEHIPNSSFKTTQYVQNCLSKSINSIAFAQWLDIVDVLALSLVSHIQYLKCIPLFSMRVTWSFGIFNNRLSNASQKHVRKLSLGRCDVVDDLHPLPQGLQELYIEAGHTFAASIHQIPNLKKLRFPGVQSTAMQSKNKHLYLPISIETVYLARSGTQCIENMSQLTNLVSLRFPGGFLEEQKFQDLPSSLQRLSLNCRWGHDMALLPTTCCLPPALLQLELLRFSQPLYAHMFPSTLTDLELSSMNEVWLPNTFPHTLKKLRLNEYNQPLKPNMLPPYLEELDIRCFRGYVLEADVLPLSLTTLVVGNGFHAPLAQLYTNLTYLNVRARQVFSSSDFPSNLITLQLNMGYYCSDDAFAFPDSLQNLTLSGPFHLNAIIPAVNLTTLVLLTSHASLVDVFPSKLENLVVKGKSLQHFILPQSVRSLSLDHFTHAQLCQMFHNVDDYPNLTSLHFGFGFKYKLDGNFVFPKSLLHVDFGMCFNQRIPTKKLPPNIRQLTCRSSLHSQFKNWSFQYCHNQNLPTTSICFL